MADWLAWWEETVGAIAEVADQVQTQTAESVEQWLSQSSTSEESDLEQWVDQLDANLESFNQWWDQSVPPIGQELDQAITQTFDEWEHLLQPWVSPLLDWHLDPQAMQVLEEAENALDEVVFGFLGSLGVELEFGAEDWDEETLWNEIAPKSEPSNAWHPACKNCQNFHGRSYDGNLLICAMHPYGVEGDRCFDWSDAEPA
ncbi:MAG: hypothetical protein AAF889_12900 [Cyanobacteria bacterium P01_D01_bin.73]